MKTIKVIDSHTEGEPTRFVYEGFPDLGHGSLFEQLAILKQEYDAYRQAVILEPRGNDVLVGALLCRPQNPKHTCGVIFFNNKGYLGMCGHGTIGLIASLHYLGKIDIGQHIVETPVGNVTATLHSDGSVSVENVPAYRYRQQVSVELAGYGKISGDIAWGGNWFFLVNQHGQELIPNNIPQLTAFSQDLMHKLRQEGITGENGAEIDHIELFAKGKNDANSQSFVLCPGGAYDRSPCGTGTSAKLACLAADDKLVAGEVWIQESIIGGRFFASYQPLSDGKIIPTIRGTAYVCGENTLLLNPKDPFCWGIRCV